MACQDSLGEKHRDVYRCKHGFIQSNACFSLQDHNHAMCCSESLCAREFPETGKPEQPPEFNQAVTGGKRT